jgi:hypothetical protein
MFPEEDLRIEIDRSVLNGLMYISDFIHITKIVFAGVHN